MFYLEGKSTECLAKITLHNILILVAILLFESKATDIQVMGRLQYLLNAFQIYYYNTPTLAKIHAKRMEFSDNKFLWSRHQIYSFNVQYDFNHHPDAQKEPLQLCRRPKNQFWQHKSGATHPITHSQATWEATQQHVICKYCLHHIYGTILLRGALVLYTSYFILFVNNDT